MGKPARDGARVTGLAGTRSYGPAAGAALLAAVLLITAACSNEKGPAPAGEGAFRPCGELPAGVEPLARVAAPERAEGFSIHPLEPRSGAVEVRVAEAWGEERTRRFWLVPCGADARTLGRPPEDVTLLVVPVRTVATTSTTELPFLAELEALEHLVGHAGLDFVFDPRVRARAEAGRVASIGSPAALDVERLLELAPEVLLVDAAGEEFLTDLEILEKAGIAVVPVPAYREATALARSEWIRFVALFLGRDRRAAELFEGIAGRYGALAASVAAEVDPDDRPEVLIGGPWNDTWWVPGGLSSTARLLADAGGRYFMAEADTRGNVALDIERVVEIASSAEAWLHPSAWRSRAEILAADPRLARFDAFRSGNVWAHDRRRHDAGSDYYESGVLWADRMLADYVAILHPRLVPGHQLVYHRRLGEGLDGQAAPVDPRNGS
ncbi:MAG: ABC transporter substrate-binding protein [Holophagales bacterium]|nr:ABC transporter substrate-binding protein [Holophagales bacterium]